MFERSVSIESKEQNLNRSHAVAANRFLDRETLSIFSLFLFFVVSMAVLSMVLSSVANAQTSALANDPATLAASADVAGDGKPFKFSGQVVFETLRTADEAAPASYSGWYMATGSATHKKYAVTTTLKGSYTREYTYQRDDGQDGDFENPLLSVAKSFRQGKDFDFDWLDSISISATGTVGANRESARRTFLWSNGAVVTGAKAIGRFNLLQSFSYSHSFFDKDIRADGTVNSPHSLKSGTILYYSITDRLSVGGSFTYAYAISFQGVGRGAQLSSATVDYSITDQIIASVGVASERATIEPDGQSDRVRFYTPDAAQYFVDFVLLL